jgi:hypothetical protein
VTNVCETLVEEQTDKFYYSDDLLKRDIMLKAQNSDFNLVGHTKTRCPRAEESGENEAPHETSHEASELGEFASGSDNPSTAPADKNDMSGW